MVSRNTRCIPSLSLYLLKLTVHVTSCFTCFNNKNEKDFVCTPLELRILQLPDSSPLVSLGYILQSSRLSLAGYSGAGWRCLEMIFWAGVGSNEQECHNPLAIPAGGEGGRFHSLTIAVAYDWKTA